MSCLIRTGWRCICGADTSAIRRIDVLNRGIGGQEAIEELLRFDPDVFAEEPSLVIWQVGTNAVFRKQRVRSR